MEREAVETALNALAPALVAGAGGISGLTRLSGGASQETWKFDVIGAAQSTFILRRSPFESPRNGEAIGQIVEASIINQARMGGAKVPLIAHICQPEDGLGEAFIMSYIEGETIARKILRDGAYASARENLAYQCGVELAKIHALSMSDLPATLPKSDGLDQLSRYEAIYRSFNVNRPILELAIAWLKSTHHAPHSLGLVHGDFRNGNLIVGEDGLRAVLDWELAHIGDPREDLGWICVNSWRFGATRHVVGGFGALDQLLGGYRDGGGADFEPGHIRWFQALGSFKWGVMCLIMYHAFQSGADRTIERAMIGRRTSEAEYDLLNLMEGAPYA
jgi:aminoglycoside phosphotransferase (APT) family kinase protein